MAKTDIKSDEQIVDDTYSPALARVMSTVTWIDPETGDYGYPDPRSQPESSQERTGNVGPGNLRLIPRHRRF